MPAYLKVSAKFLGLPAENGEIIEAILGEYPFDSFEIEGSVVHAYAPFEALNSPLKIDIEEAVSSFISEPLIWTPLEKENWNAVWENSFEPISIPPSIYIKAPFHPVPEEPYEFVLTIEPKMSFGTGHHETTRLMIQSMLEYRAIWPNSHCLDMGCGTGILAIMACKLGARKTLGIDIEDWAVENTLENASLNQCHQIIAAHGDAELLETIPPFAFDHVLANIQKNVLLQDISDYLKVLKRGGTLRVSGFFPEDLSDIQSHFESKGLLFHQAYTGNKWCCATFLYV